MSPADEPLLRRDGDIDIAALVRRVWAGRWWIVLSVVACTAIMAAVAYLLPPVYRATTVLVDASQERSGIQSFNGALGQLGGLASLAGLTTGTNSQVQESIAVLESRGFTERFLREEHLLPELFPDRWDASAQRWKGKEEEHPTLAEAFRFFDTEVRSINFDRRTGLIALQIEWKDGEKAAEWANKLVARINAEMRSRAITRTNAFLEFLEKELASTPTVETRAAISRIIEAQINQRMLANVTHEYAFRVVDAALRPDPNDPAKPNKLVLLALGPMIGLFLGVLVVLLRGVMLRR